jgi:hypothetical protein
VKAVAELLDKKTGLGSRSHQAEFCIPVNLEVASTFLAKPLSMESWFLELRLVARFWSACCHCISTRRKWKATEIRCSKPRKRNPDSPDGPDWPGSSGLQRLHSLHQPANF